MHGKFSHMMIASDVDGTLAHDFSVYPQRNIEAIRYFVSQGGFFTIATGRSLNISQDIIETFAIKGPVILLNGSAVYDTVRGEYLQNIFLPETAKGYLPLITAHPGLLAVRVMSENEGLHSIYVRKGDENHPLAGANYQATLAEPEELADLRWQKLLLITCPEESEGFRRFLLEQNFPDVDFVASSESYYEMMPKGTSKGTGLRLAAKHLAVKMKNTIGIGDYENDVELLRTAEFSAAPANALPQIKALADAVVCDCREGALADLVELLEQRVSKVASKT